MAHYLDRAIGSDASYQVLQLRRLRGELGAQSFDSSHRRLNRVSGYRAFIADPDMDGDGAQPVPLSIAVGAADDADE